MTKVATKPIDKKILHPQIIKNTAEKYPKFIMFVYNKTIYATQMFIREVYSIRNKNIPFMYIYGASS